MNFFLHWRMKKKYENSRDAIDFSYWILNFISNRIQANKMMIDTVNFYFMNDSDHHDDEITFLSSLQNKWVSVRRFKKTQQNIAYISSWWGKRLFWRIYRAPTKNLIWIYFNFFGFQSQRRRNAMNCIKTN